MPNSGANSARGMCWCTQVATRICQGQGILSAAIHSISIGTSYDQTNTKIHLIPKRNTNIISLLLFLVDFLNLVEKLCCVSPKSS
ncbi:Uncharacterized protein HZ326_29406 [Fusarium oxysporum f. sp. albedinis]|nr:Uncharacterized protein HZ326_29406 [Fusarium oxysporum f. sp. albedinis]